MDALLAALRTARDRAMVLAMLLGGLHRCEVLGLRLADVNAGERRLFVAHGKGGDHTLAALKSIRARKRGGCRIYVILDNLSANKTRAIRRWAQRSNTELCFTPTNASWANPIEAQFGPVRTFVMGGSDHPSHAVLARKLQDYLRWRDANTRHP